ncbi:MAG: bifunctional precorrin-2 dehydrogenase/sirohydrochlorin ferrochelatase [Actinomycetota bacterium]|nr:bifunctional precorrin-2 dehydrogenase/sirohydrochlorin ferrochelatase [Actinomycetota bacterium]
MELPEENNLYFACIDLSDRPCLVVGGGPMALEKVDGLLEAGGRVTVVAREPVTEIAELARSGRIGLMSREFRDSDVDDAWLVIAATGDSGLDGRVAHAAEERNRLVNVADVPKLCNFILPAILRDGPIAIAISTAGASPALAQRIKREVKAILDRPFGVLASRLRDLRPWAKSRLVTYEQRRDFFRSIVDGRPDPLLAIEEGRFDDLDRQIEDLKNATLPPPPP